MSPEPAEPEARVDALAQSIRRLAPFDPKVVIFLTGIPGEQGEGEARAIVVEALRQLGSAGRAAGVSVALEPIHRSAKDEFTMVTDLPETEELLVEAGDPSIGILFDTWHLWDTSDVLEHTRRLASRFPAVHVNDWRDPTRNWDDRALPGKGVMDLPAILGALEAGGFYEPETRPFLGHVTVARVPSGKRVAPVALGPPESLRFDATRVTLYCSLLGSGPARYEALETVVLTGAPTEAVTRSTSPAPDRSRSW